MENQDTTQVVVVSQAAVNPAQGLGRLALFDDTGAPIATDDLVLASVTGADVPLTGYAKGSAEAVAATDTVNEAIGKVEAQAAVDPTGADVVLTGYVAGSADDVAATDSVNEAIAKLEARIAALETA